jgi:hypothetical protein
LPQKGSPSTMKNGRAKHAGRDRGFVGALQPQLPAAVVPDRLRVRRLEAELGGDALSAVLSLRSMPRPK